MVPTVEAPGVRSHHIIADCAPGTLSAERRRENAVNVLKTTMLLAALTAIFMGVGYLIGGQGGAVAALVAAARRENPAAAVGA
jgi:hypothetical protein